MGDSVQEKQFTKIVTISKIDELVKKLSEMRSGFYTLNKKQGTPFKK